MKKSNGALSLLIAAGLLAACNNYGGVTNNPPPGTGSNCGGPPSSNDLQVLFPIPNSKSAPAALGNIYVSTKGQLPPSNSFNFYVVPSNGSTTFTSPFFGISKSQIPTPHATPSYAKPIYYASSLPASYIIGPNQSVSVFWNDGGTGCTPHFLVTSFRTHK
ncbi:MAG TPA: hypothetical protein VHR97_03095 [Candidatus Baltobacteraceae bacterium]|nr:hypothetical protein [Candidatus Baltobacteraceae bacterium]